MKRVFLLLCLILLLVDSRSLGTPVGLVVYSNDFNTGEASLADFVTGGEGQHSVKVTSGQLAISAAAASYGYAAINTSHFSPPYSSRLGLNPGMVTWSLNLSNQDGVMNNYFFFALASKTTYPKAEGTSSYVLEGGGYVGNRMMLYCKSGGDHIPIIDITNGLPPLRSKGSIRITYTPRTGSWNLYGAFGDTYIDPQLVSSLLGSGVNDRHKYSNLPYMSFGGGNTGIDYFDNVTVTVVPEPATLLLLSMGTVIVRRTMTKRPFPQF